MGGAAGKMAQEGGPGLGDHPCAYCSFRGSLRAGGTVTSAGLGDEVLGSARVSPVKLDV